MKKSLLVLSAAALIVSPGGLSAQKFGVGGRVGSVGIGIDAAVGLGPKVSFRGGFGFLPFEYDATKIFDPEPGVGVDLKIPEKWYNFGLDLDLLAGIHVGGGMLFKSEDISLTAVAEPSATFTIGDATYTGTQIGEVRGSVDTKGSAPYLMAGFGKLTRAGIGLYLDLGVAFFGESPVKLEATKGDPAIINSPEFQAELRKEEAQAEEDLPTWARNYWPILSLGLKFGIGK